MKLNDLIDILVEARRVHGGDIEVMTRHYDTDWGEQFIDHIELKMGRIDPSGRGGHRLLEDAHDRLITTRRYDREAVRAVLIKRGFVSDEHLDGHMRRLDENHALMLAEDEAFIASTPFIALT